MYALDKFRKLKVMVGVPSQSQAHVRSLLCLQAMMNYCLMARIGEYKQQEVRLCNTRGSILPNLRVDVVKQAFAERADKILWIDADQTFPKELLHKLMARNVDVVAANIATKTIPAGPTARRKSDKFADGLPVYTDEDSTGLEKVWRIGCGVMLVDVKVYKKTGLNVFGQPWREEQQKYQGEDWTMCEAIEKAGFDIYIDHDISQVIGHLGDYEYTHDVVGEIQKGVERGQDLLSGAGGPEQGRPAGGKGLKGWWQGARRALRHAQGA